MGSKAEKRLVRLEEGGMECRAVAATLRRLADHLEAAGQDITADSRALRMALVVIASDAPLAA